MSRRRSWKNARCLVTGASSGLGRAMAEQLVQEGARVLLTGRSESKLTAIRDGLLESGAAPSHVHTLAADLTDSSGRTELVTHARDQFGALDLVVQSAGVGATGHFETHEPSILRRVFEINLFALAEVARDVLPLLSEGIAPSMIHLGSIVARRGLPGRAEYTASKFAVAGFTESLRAEWAKYGIHILLLNPGFTATEFERNLLIDTARYSVTNRRTMTPQAVATAALNATLKRKNELTLTRGGKLLLQVNRFLPRFVDWGFKRWTLHLFPDSPVLNRLPQRDANGTHEGHPNAVRPNHRARSIGETHLVSPDSSPRQRD